MHKMPLLVGFWCELSLFWSHYIFRHWYKCLSIVIKIPINPHKNAPLLSSKCLSIAIRMTLYLSKCLSISQNASLSLKMSLYLLKCLCISQNASLSLKMPLYLSKCLSISQNVFLSFKMSLYLSKCLSISQNAFISLVRKYLYWANYMSWCSSNSPLKYYKI